MKGVELILYVTGKSPVGRKAEADARRLCAEQPVNAFALTVIDTSLHPDQAEADAVRVTPTLIRRRPTPERRVVGDLSDTGRVLEALGLSDVSGEGDTLGTARS